LGRHWSIRHMSTTSKVDLSVASGVHTISYTNTLLTDPNNGLLVLGGKTGYLIESKCNLAVRIMDSRRRPVDVIVLGSDTRDSSMRDAEILVKWPWNHHQW